MSSSQRTGAEPPGVQDAGRLDSIVALSLAMEAVRPFDKNRDPMVEMLLSSMSAGDSSEEREAVEQQLAKNRPPPGLTPDDQDERGCADGSNNVTGLSGATNDLGAVADLYATRDMVNLQVPTSPKSGQSSPVGGVVSPPVGVEQVLQAETTVLRLSPPPQRSGDPRRSSTDHPTAVVETSSEGSSSQQERATSNMTVGSPALEEDIRRLLVYSAHLYPGGRPLVSPVDLSGDVPRSGCGLFLRGSGAAPGGGKVPPAGVPQGKKSEAIISGEETTGSTTEEERSSKTTIASSKKPSLGTDAGASKQSLFLSDGSGMGGVDNGMGEPLDNSAVSSELGSTDQKGRDLAVAMAENILLGDGGVPSVVDETVFVESSAYCRAASGGHHAATPVVGYSAMTRVVCPTPPPGLEHVLSERREQEAFYSGKSTSKMAFNAWRELCAEEDVEKSVSRAGAAPVSYGAGAGWITPVRKPRAFPLESPATGGGRVVVGTPSQRGEIPSPPMHPPPHPPRPGASASVPTLGTTAMYSNFAQNSDHKGRGPPHLSPAKSVGSVVVPGGAAVGAAPTTGAVLNLGLTRPSPQRQSVVQDFNSLNYNNFLHYDSNPANNPAISNIGPVSQYSNYGPGYSAAGATSYGGVVRGQQYQQHGGAGGAPAPTTYAAGASGVGAYAPPYGTPTSSTRSLRTSNYSSTVMNSDCSYTQLPTTTTSGSARSLQKAPAPGYGNQGNSGGGVPPAAASAVHGQREHATHHGGSSGVGINVPPASGVGTTGSGGGPGPAPADSIRGRICQLATSCQASCRLLQQKVTFYQQQQLFDTEIAQIVEEVGPDIGILMSSQFGNYFSQRLFEAVLDPRCPVGYCVSLLTSLREAFVTVACNVHGTRAIQSLWELLAKRCQGGLNSGEASWGAGENGVVDATAAEEELFRAFSQLFVKKNGLPDRKTAMLLVAESANGNHAVQRALAIFQGRWLSFVIDRLHEVGLCCV